MDSAHGRASSRVTALARGIREYGPGHFWVPMDDYTTMVYNFMYSYGSDPGISELERMEKNNGNGPEYVDTNTFRSFANAGNNYRIDRAIQRTETFTGIPGVNTQDRALQETMGRIVDRSREKLGPADKAIIATRRMLLDAIKTVKSAAIPPESAPATTLSEPSSESCPTSRPGPMCFCR